MEEKILEKLKLKIAISEIKKEYNIAKKKKFISKKIAMAACACLILTTGVVFSKEIEDIVKYWFGLNESVNKAAENGYVEEIDSNSVESEVVLENQEEGIVINDIDVSLKLDEFVMDDLVLSTNMTFQFDERIKEVFDLDKVQHISIRDLIILDEENKILYCTASEPEFKILKEKYNLSQEYLEDTEYFYNCTSGYGLIGHNKEQNIIKYNIEVNPSDRFFPKSKELRCIFTKIKLEKFEEYTGQDIENGEYLDSNSIILKGDWEFKFDVPEKMYNRENAEYEVVSISDPNVEVYLSQASETGFCLGAIISNVDETPDLDLMYIDEMDRKYKNGELTDEEWMDFMDELSQMLSDKDLIKRTNWIKDKNGKMTKEKVSHVENEKGKKFYSLLSMNKNDFLEGRKFDFLDIYEMTKSDLTEELTVRLYKKDDVIEIKLKKVN